MRPEEKRAAEMLQTGQISRRDFVRLMGMLGVSASGLSAILAACAPPAPAPAAPADAPAAAPAAIAGPKRGGILKSALFAPKNLDMAFSTSASDHQIGYQWHDQFIDVDPQGIPQKETSLATDWSWNDDATVWEFEVRKGVTFHNGKGLTAKDVVYTFNRLRDPEVGAATVSLYANVQNVEALDDFHVRFTLEKPNPEFILDMADYHAMILDADIEDQQTEWNGTGPFMVDTYMPEDRITFKRNPNYWIKDEDGQSLPYVDGMEWLFLNETSAQADALQGGQVDFLTKLTPEYLERFGSVDGIEVNTSPGNWHFVIHMRADIEPFSDNRVRQAIKAATDRSALLQTAALGYGAVGRDTPVGPLYGDYYLDVPEPQRDVEKAKALLAEAGKTDLKFTITVQNSLGAPAIATIWQEQLREAGIEAEIELVPVDVYYGDLWLTCDVGLTDWGPRVYPLTYLQLAYQCGAKWNGSHWCNDEVDQLTEALASEPDRAKRVEMYHRVQEIMIEEGSFIIPYFQDTGVVFRTAVKPIITIPFMPSAVRLDRVWLEK